MKENKNTWCVYCHTNNINGKKYIGITSRGDNPNIRWANGKNYHNRHSGQNYFENAIKKYGWDNFEHIILLNNLSKEEACQKEIELIKLYDTTNREKGYNISLGGECNFFGLRHTEETKLKIINSKKEYCKEVNQYDMNGNFIKQYYSINEASRKTGVPLHIVSSICNRNKRENGTLIKSSHGFQFRFSNDCDDVLIDYNINFGEKCVLQFDIYGNFIEEFISSYDCERKTDIKQSSISNCCNRKISQVKGFIFRYKDDEYDIEEASKNVKKNIPIYQIDENNNIIKRFSSRGSAGKELGLSRTNIGRVCDGIQKQTKGYRFCYVKDYTPTTIK